MFEQSHFGRIINLSINIFLGIALVLVGLILADNVDLMVFLQSFVVSLGIGYIICDLIPAPVWGKRFASWIGIKNKLAFHLLSTVIGGMVLIPIISFFCQFVAFGENMLQVWIHALPYLLLTGYLVLVFFMPLCTKLAKLLTKKGSS